MERLTKRNECGDAYYPECYERCYGEGSSEKCNDCDYDEKICETLADYEDTELTPEQIVELSESVKKVQEHFDGVITAGQIVDFFVDFYIAQGDDSRVEDAILLTNEEASRYRELKERDTAKAPIKDTDSGVRYTDDYICPNCGKHFIGTGIAAFCYHCGQRLKWEE